MVPSSNVRLAYDGGDPVRSEPYPDWPRVTESSRAAVMRVLESGHWWRSRARAGMVEKLESHFSKALGATATIAVSSGTAALELAFAALGVGPGDEVLVPATTFISTATAVAACGAVPVPVDVYASTLCLDVDHAATRLTARTKAIAPVHLAGNVADLDAVLSFAAEHDLFVVEDAAQAIGSQWRGRLVGAIGDAGVTSFQAGKILAAGEGGAVFVRSDDELARAIYRLSHCGRDMDGPWDEHVAVGSNRRLTEFQAALVLSHMTEMTGLSAARSTAASALASGVTDRGLGTPMGITNGTTYRALSSFWLWLPDDLPASIDARTVAHYLGAEGTPAGAMYPAWPGTAAFEGCTSTAPCPVSERAAQRVIWYHHRMLLDGERGVADMLDALDKVLTHLR